MQPVKQIIAQMGEAATESVPRAWSLPAEWPEATDDLFRQFDSAVHADAATALAATWGWTLAAHRGESAGLVLWSTGFGAGKTHLARAAHNTLCRAGVLGSFHSAPDWFGAIRDSYSRNAPEGALFHEWASRPYFVFDDVGKEHRGAGSLDWAREKYFRLFDMLYDRRSLLVTSNLPPDELASWIGGAAWSRLAGMCGMAGFVDLSNLPDYRLRV